MSEREDDKTIAHTAISYLEQCVWCRQNSDSLQDKITDKKFKPALNVTADTQTWTKAMNAVAYSSAVGSGADGGSSPNRKRESRMLEQRTSRGHQRKSTWSGDRENGAIPCSQSGGKERGREERRTRRTMKESLPCCTVQRGSLARCANTTRRSCELRPVVTWQGGIEKPQRDCNKGIDPGMSVNTKMEHRTLAWVLVINERASFFSVHLDSRPAGEDRRVEERFVPLWMSAISRCKTRKFRRRALFFMFLHVSME